MGSLAGGAVPSKTHRFQPRIRGYKGALHGGAVDKEWVTNADEPIPDAVWHHHYHPRFLRDFLLDSVSMLAEHTIAKADRVRPSVLIVPEKPEGV